MEFECHPVKDRSNSKKHGISFCEAAPIFGDPLAITYKDPDHSNIENRYIPFGLSKNSKLLVVSHTEQNKRVRIISARLMTRKKRKIYAEK